MALVIYVGNFVSERVKIGRGLPAWNAAGVNRMRRISHSLLAAGAQVVVLSSSTAMRMRSDRLKVYSRQVERCGKLPVVHAAALAIPGLNVLIEPFIVAWQFMGLCRRRDVAGVVLYCYYPSHVAVGLVARLVFFKPVVLDLEDVSKPHIGDWRRGSGVNPLHQIVGWLCLKITLALVRGVIVPTERFIPFAGRARREVITGCMEVPVGVGPTDCIGDELRVFFSGKIETEHGIDVLMEALTLLERKPRPDGVRIRCDICGQGPSLEWVRSTADGMERIQVVVHGFVSDSEYVRLLNDAHVCIVLQKPDGRHATFKTPSKGYEYMGHGKATVVTRIGDFPLLPQQTRLLLDPCSGEALAEMLRTIQLDSVQAYGRAALEYAQQHWTTERNGRLILGLFSRKTKGGAV